MEDEFKYYTTKDGDTWDSISYLLFKQSDLIDFLVAWNEEYSEYFIFPSGKILKYKELKLKDTNLPPWRR